MRVQDLLYCAEICSNFIYRFLSQVKEQAALAWLFIVDRRIEAPEAFQRIQTHRVKLALLTQQELFIAELAEGEWRCHQITIILQNPSSVWIILINVEKCFEPQMESWKSKRRNDSRML